MNNKLYIIIFSFLLFTSYSEANICSPDTSLNITVMVDEELTCSYKFIIVHEERIDDMNHPVSLDTIHPYSIIPGCFVISKDQYKGMMKKSNRIYLCISKNGYDDLIVNFINSERLFYFYNIYTPRRLKYRRRISHNIFTRRKYSCLCYLRCDKNLNAYHGFRIEKKTMDEIQQEILKWSKYSHGDSKI